MEFIDLFLSALQNGDSAVYLIVLLILGLINVPLVNAVKSLFQKAFKYDVGDRGALLVVLVMSLVLAVLQLFLSGQIEALTFNALAVNAAAIGYTAKFFYKWLHSGQKPEEE